MMVDTMNSNRMNIKLQKNPLNRSRNYTDILYLSLLFTILAVGIGLVAYVLPKSFEHKEKSSIENLIVESNPIINIFNIERHLDYEFNGYLSSAIKSGIWYMFFGAVIILGLLFVYKLIPNIATYITIICASTYLILQQIYQLITSCAAVQAMSTKNYTDYQPDASYLYSHNIIPSLLYLVFIFIILIYIKGIDVKSISEILMKSFRALFYFPSLIILGFIILGIQIIIVMPVTGIIQDSRPSPLMKCLLILSTNYIMLVLYYFGKMVVFEAVAIYHWAPNKEIPMTTSLRCVFTVARYHLGSIAFGATLILPFFQAIYVALKTGSYGARKFSDIFMKYLCKIVLICNITDFALIQTSAHGLNYFASTQKTFHLMVKNNILSLVIVYIYEALLKWLMLISFIICLASFDMFNTREFHITDSVAEMLRKPYDPLFTIFTFLMTSLLIVEAAVHATLLCTLEDKEENDEEKTQQLQELTFDTAM